MWVRTRKSESTFGACVSLTCMYSIQEDMQCTFICNYSGGASSNGQIGQHPVHSSAIEAAATQSSGNGTSRANGTLEGINDGNCTVKRALKPGSWQYESDDVELMD